jgi:branched-chain amino acid transport system permease protein
MSDQIVFALQLVITGIAVGGIYSLMALGFVLIFKASAVVNFGPGELVLFGAYVTWATILHMKWPLYIALPTTLAVAILLGLVIERGILRPLIGEPIISVIMVTFGFASVIRSRCCSRRSPSASGRCRSRRSSCGAS